MRILHYGKYYPPFNGGVERVTFDLVENLVQRGHQVDVLCFNNTQQTLLETAPAGYRIFRSGIFANLASTPLSFRNIYQFTAMAGQYDIIHVHLPNPVANLALMLSGTRARVVLHWHADIVKQKTLLRFYDPLQQWMLRRADAIIASSPPYAESSPWLLQHAAKTTVIPLGLDCDDKTVEPARVDAFRARFAGRKIVFSLGRLIYYKGFEYLIRAAAQLPDDVVVVIGGVGELEAELKALVSSLGVQDKVVMIGSVPQADIGSWFAACDLFCLSSVERSEAFGLVQVEAMYFGKPVVSTGIPGSGVGWVNEDGVSGRVVPPANPAALAAAVTDILGDPQRQAQFAQGARQRYEKRFALKPMIDKTLELYEHLLKQPAASSASAP